MATVDRPRVLPWRRGAAVGGPPELLPVVNAFRRRHPKSDFGVIVRAYEVAERAHQDVIRQSGEPYISHPLAVAQILADLGLD